MPTRDPAEARDERTVRVDDIAPCAAHARWKEVSAAVRDLLDRTTRA